MDQTYIPRELPSDQLNQSPNIYLSGAERIAITGANIGEKALETTVNTTLDGAVDVFRHVAGEPLLRAIALAPLVSIEGISVDEEEDPGYGPHTPEVPPEENPDLAQPLSEVA